MGHAAAVFAIRDWLFICASPMSEDGVRIVGAITTVDRQTEPSAIGIAVQEALAASNWIAPPATEQSWRASYDPMFAVTGFENVRDLMLAAAIVTVDEEGETLMLALVEKPSAGNVVALPKLDAMIPEGRWLIGDGVQQLLAASRPPSS